jgi:hypothetical protein
MFSVKQIVASKMALLIATIVFMAAGGASAADEPARPPLLNAEAVATASKALLTGSVVVRAPVGPWFEANTRDNRSVSVFFYGSYMVPQFVASRLSVAAVRSMKPAVAYGARRVFDFVVPAPTGSGLQKPTGGPTIELSAQPSDVVNGVVVDISAVDARKIAGPENVFDLVPMLVTVWPINKADPLMPQKAFALVAPVSRRDASLEPHAEFWCAIDKGITLFGGEFHRLWRETTYRGGLATRVAEKQPKCN